MRCAAVMLAGIGLIAPRCTLQAGEAPARTAVADVALTGSGELAGAVVSDTGAPVDGAIVTLSKQGKAIARTTTDEQGTFALAVKSGTYQLHAGHTSRSVRVWQADAAPPAAAEEATLVVGTTVRGQEDYYGDPYYDMGGLDFISLATVTTSAGALAVSIVNQSDLNDLNDKVDRIENTLDELVSP
jgi:hypothetical protein